MLFQKNYVFDEFLLFVDSSVHDTAQFSSYHLIVQVKDLGNQSLGHCALPIVEITIEENS